MTILAGKPLIDAINRYKDGDTAAFDTIYYESIHYVSKCVLNVLNRTAPNASNDLLQDILQDTYLTIASNLHTLRSADAFLQWAGQIATHHAQRTWNKDLRRQQMEQPEDEMIYELMDEDFIPEDILENKEKQQLIRQMLAQLPTNQYLCMLEYFYNGLKESEVSAKLGIPLNTVKTNLSRAKKKLKDIVQTHEKRSGVKLYSMSWLMLGLFWLEVRAFYLDPKVQQNTLRFVHQGMGVYSDSIPSQGRSGSSSGASGARAAKSAAAGSKGLFHAAAAKVLAGVLAAAIAAGAIIGVQQARKPQKHPAPTTEATAPATTITTAPDVTEPVSASPGGIFFTVATDRATSPHAYEVVITNQVTGEEITQSHSTSYCELILMPGDYTLTVKAEGYDPYTTDIRVESDVYTDGLNFTLVTALPHYSANDLSSIQSFVSILAIPSGGTNAVHWQPTADGGDTQEIMWLTLKNAMWYGKGIETQSAQGNNEQITAYCADAENFLMGLFGQYPQDLYTAVKEEHYFTANDGTKLTLWYPPSLGSIGTDVIQIQQIMPDVIQVLAQHRSVTHGTGQTPTTDVRYGDYVLVTLQRSDNIFGWTCLDAIRFPGDAQLALPDTSDGITAIPDNSSIYDLIMDYSDIYLDQTGQDPNRDFFPKKTESAAPQPEQPTEDSAPFDDGLSYMPKATIDAEDAYHYAESHLRVLWNTKTIVTETTPLLYVGEGVDAYGFTYYVFDWCNYNAETGEYTVIDTVRISSYGGDPI